LSAPFSHYRQQSWPQCLCSNSEFQQHLWCI